MKKLISLFLFSSTLAACSSTPLSPAGQRVSITKDKNAVAACSMVGMVEATTASDNDVELRNMAAEDKGDTILLESEDAGVFTKKKQGKVYSCHTGLDQAVIDQKITEHLGQISGCYVIASNAAGEKRAGKVSVAFEIVSTGHVRNAHATQDTFKDPSMEACLLGVISKIQFPPPGGGGTISVEHPFAFYPARKSQ